MLVDFTPQQYVSFEKLTGDVISVGPSIEEGVDYIAVDYNDVESILSLKESKDVYKVVYDTRLKDYKLVNRKEETILYNSIHKFIDYQDDYDVKAKIKYGRYIRFILNPELQEALKDKTVLDTDFIFSITKKDNPHYLLRQIKVNFTEKTEFNFTFLPNEYSIYTKGSFSKYVIEEML